MRAGLGIIFLLIAQAAQAGPPELVWPLDCVQGDTCYIEDYVDADPGPGQRDFACGLKSRDGHKGTDIVLRDFEMMEDGVPITAAAAGIVAATRDGMPDIAVSAETRDSISGRECGNAVRIDHGDGWQTMYCHMKQGSVTVRKGDQVAAGESLGLVGLSGLTNIPHVHLSVLKDGAVIDPFQPASDSDDKCEPSDTMLWAVPPDYHKAGLFTAGLATKVPEFGDVKSGAARESTAQPDQPLVLYGHVFHAQQGDVMHLSVTGPDSEIYRKSILLKNPQVQLFRAYGRKAPPEGWPEGSYRGIVRLKRGGALLAWRHADILVTSR